MYWIEKLVQGRIQDFSRGGDTVFDVNFLPSPWHPPGNMMWLPWPSFLYVLVVGVVVAFVVCGPPPLM